MNTMPVAQWSVGILIAPLLLGPSLALAQEPGERLRREAAKGWARYRDFEATLQGTFRTERRELIGDKQREYRADVIKKQTEDSNLLVVERNEGGKYTGTVEAKNPRYAFRLGRKQPSSQWVIEKIKLAPFEDEAGKTRKNDLSAPLSLFDLDLADLVASGSLIVKSAEDEGDGLYRVTFAFSPATNRSYNGWVILDPTHDWIVRRGEYDLASDGGSVKRVVTNEYKDGRSGKLILTKSKIATTGTYSAGPIHYLIVSEADLSESDVPAGDFTLTAFGLPEPFEVLSADTRGKRRRWYLWAGAVGVGCIVAAMLLRRAKRRTA